MSLPLADEKPMLIYGLLIERIKHNLKDPTRHMGKIFGSKTQNQGVDEITKNSLLMQNVRALLALFVITAFAGALRWYSFVTTFIYDPTSFGYDLNGFLLAAQFFLTGGDMYNVVWRGLDLRGLDLSPFFYPPPSIYVFVPLSYLAIEQARIVMDAISIAALLFSVFIITKILAHYGKYVSKFQILLICAALFLFEPVVHNLQAVTINLVILFLITLFYYLLFVRARSTGAGIVLGIAFILKVWPIFLVFLDFLRKSKKC